MKFYFLLLMTLLFFACDNTTPQNTKQKEAAATTERKLVWSDEFDIDGLPNPANWSYAVGDACELPMGCGWGNNEAQYYTDKQAKNARVENGFLVIEAHKEKTGTRNYSSARLVSKDKADFLYGTFEIRAKIPSGRGTWSAIWMMPTKNTYGIWPRSGELDIMEHVGYERDTIYGTPHTQSFNGMLGTQKTGAIEVLNGENNFHIYKLVWTEDKIEWYVDDQHYHTFVNEKNIEAWPFNHPFHFILNLAVGGNWGAKHGIDDTIWPRKMLVDYVRVYQ